MKVTGYACDVCDKFEHDLSNWFHVTQGKQTVDVCSAECLRKLGVQMKAGINMEEVAKSAEEFVCEKRGCGRTFDSQQGLSMHITRTHQKAS